MYINLSRVLQVTCCWLAIMLFAADARADIVKDQIDPLLAEARRGGCSNTSNELTAILCSGQLRVGVRDNYRGFGFRDVSGLKGFEIDVASRIAERLGVAPVLSVVTPTNRISKLVGGRSEEHTSELQSH